MDQRLSNEQTREDIIEEIIIQCRLHCVCVSGPCPPLQRSPRLVCQYQVLRCQ